MARTTVGVKLDDETRTRLKRLGEIKDRSVHWLMKEAIGRYVEAEERGPVRETAGRFSAGHGLGLRRTALHRALTRAAADRGVDLRFGVRARGISERGLVTDRGELRARCVVGADGLHSRVRRWAGLSAPGGMIRRFGIRRHYAVRPWTDLVDQLE